MADVEISQLITGIVNADIEYPATNPLDTTEAATGTTNKFILSDMLNYNLVSQGFTTYASCRVATTGPLTATYNNGTAGVNATLTNSGAQAALSIDGVVLSVNDRVLVKNQVASLENGIYFVQDPGSATSNWILKRATDFDQTAEIVQYGATLVSQGTANGGSYYQETAAQPITIGVSAITFAQFFNPTAYLNGVTGTGAFVGSDGATLVAPNLGTPASGDLSNCTGVNVSNPTGVLPVLNGGTGVTTSTGTGSTVLNVSPTLTTPSISQINDTTLNLPVATFLNVPNSVNYFSFVGQSTGLPPEIQIAGSDTDIGMNIRCKGTGGVVLISEEPTSPFGIYSGTGTQHVTNFNFSNTAATRTVTFQDADGTVAYLSDITGAAASVQVFAATGTWTKPAGIARVIVCVVGGGGGSGGTAATGAGQVAESAGGGGGGYSQKLIDVSAVPSVAVTVGTGGAGAAAGNNAGSAGNTSSFGAYCSATGGNGGNGGPATTNGGATGGAGGIGSGGDINLSGTYGSDGRVISTNAIGINFGGSSQLSPLTNYNGAGGAAVAGTIYGGGASGANAGSGSAAKAGAAGANGVVIVYEYK